MRSSSLLHTHAGIAPWIVAFALVASGCATPSPDAAQLNPHRELLERASAGDAEAQLAYGRLLLEGDAPDDTASRAEALQWIERAAETGSAEAARLVVETALAPPFEDAERAARALESAANAGSAPAMLELAKLHGRGGPGLEPDRQAARRWARASAEADHPEAMCLLGRILRTGDGGVPDPDAAVDWLRKASEAGHVDAFVDLADAYALGQGVAADRGYAVRLLRRAALEGNSRAQLRLAQFYGNGFAVQADAGEMVRWTRLAAASGEDLGTVLFASITHEGLGVKRDPRRARGMIVEAAEAGNPVAQAALADFSRRGAGGFARDFQRALHWARLSAASEEASGHEVLGELYHAGQGVAPDVERGRLHLRRAIELGSISARGRLGALLFEADSGGVSRQDGLALLEDGARLGDPFAQYSLARVLSDRDSGIENDLVRARAWAAQCAAIPNPACQKRLEELDGRTSSNQRAEAERVRANFPTTSEPGVPLSLKKPEPLYR